MTEMLTGNRFSSSIEFSSYEKGKNLMNKLITKSNSLKLEGLTKQLTKLSSDSKFSTDYSSMPNCHSDYFQKSHKSQRGYSRQLAYYPRNEIGVPKSRPRVANYTRMDHCGGVAMAYESERLKTFKNWPSDKSFIKPENLAKAGFFHDISYDGHTDRTKCAFCRGVLHSWEKGDEPIKEHRRAFSTCPFVLNMDVGNIPMKSSGKTPEPYPDAYEESKLCANTQFLCQPTLSNGGTIIQRCNLKFMTYKSRMDSFLSKSLSSDQIRQLVRNGFYDTGCNKVKCFKCHFESPYDSAIKSHDERKPLCPFIAKLEESRPSVSSPDKSESSTNVAMSTLTPKLLDSEVLTRMDSWVVRKTIELGFDQDVVKYVVLQHQYFNGEHFLSIQALIDCVRDLEEKMKECLDSTYLSCKPKAIEAWKEYVNTQQKNKKDMIQKRNKEFYERIEKDTEIWNKYFDDPVLKERISSLSCRNQQQYHELINEKLKSEQFCKICMDKPTNVIFIPCHHIVACLDCTNNISECAVCRSPIENTIEVNLD